MIHESESSQNVGTISKVNSEDGTADVLTVDGTTETFPISELHLSNPVRILFSVFLVESAWCLLSMIDLGRSLEGGPLHAGTECCMLCDSIHHHPFDS